MGSAASKNEGTIYIILDNQRINWAHIEMVDCNNIYKAPLKKESRDMLYLLRTNFLKCLPHAKYVPHLPNDNAPWRKGDESREWGGIVSICVVEDG
jgi:hypothetical protein